MSPISFTSYRNGHRIAQISILPETITVAGSPYSLFLQLPAQLTIRNCQHQNLLFSILSGNVSIDLPQQRSLHLGIITPCQINFRAFDFDHLLHPKLTVPLSLALLEYIEVLRTDDISLHLALELSVTSFDSDHHTSQIVFPDILHADFNVTVRRDDWLKNILTPSEFGTFRIIEIPFGGISDHSFIENSTSALLEAERKFKAGEYDDTVAHCRVALEKYFKEVPGTKQRKLRVEWQEKVGEATYTWLDTTLGLLKKETHKPHHAVKVGISRLDAQMILTMTTIVLAFFSRKVNDAQLLLEV